MTSTDVDTYDVIVVGSGGGLLGAYFAAARGLRTLLIEKTDKVGGTTAYSGAGLYYPGSAPIVRAGIDDSVEAARTYLRTVIDDSTSEPLQDAYLQAGIDLIDELESNEWFPPFIHAPVPDYFHGRAEGATVTGRTIFPMPVTVEELGEDGDIVRRGLFDEREGVDEGPLLTGGRALIGRALKAYLATGNGEVRLETALEGLILEDGAVVGVTAVHDGQRIELRATKGVLLAAGGFEHDAELRAKHQSPDLTGAWSNGAPGNTGDALKAAVAVGADTDLLDECWFVPGVVRANGLPVFHTGTRGGVWVNAAGERFVNETAPYDQSGHAMYKGQKSGVSHSPAHWVFDQRYLDRYGYGGDPAIKPGPEWFESGALRKAETLDEVAEITGVPADALKATVERFNGFAESGVDEDFHRGESAWDQFNSYFVGFPAGPVMNYDVGPEDGVANPLMAPIDTPPYYVGQIMLSDIGTKGGVTIDEHARVLKADGQPIERLYAAGNTTAAWTRRVYPGAGAPIGSSVAFAYLAVLDMAATGSPAGPS